MTPEYQLIQQIVQLTDNDQLERSPVLEEFAEQFAELCHDTNARLQRCAEYLEKGMRSEAVHEAQSPPALLELVKALRFDNLRKWQNICADFELAQPPPLPDDAIVERLAVECAREQELAPLLKEYRRGVYQGDRDACIRTLRKLREKDPDNPSWPENLRPLEEAQLPELLAEVRKALEQGDRKRLAALDRELRHPQRVVPPPEDIIGPLKDALLEERRRETALEGESLSRRILAAAEQENGPELATLLEQWEVLERDEAFRPGTAMRERVTAAREWFAGYQEEEARRNAFEELVEDTWELLKKRTDAAGILKRRQELESFGFPLPEALRKALDDALDQVAQRRRHRRRLVSGVVLLTVAAALATGGFYLRKRQIEARHTRMLAHMAELDREVKTEELDAYLKAVSERDAAFYNTPEVREFRDKTAKILRLKAKKRQRFKALMERLERIRAEQYAAGDEAIRALLNDAAETVPDTEAGDALARWRQAYESWKNRGVQRATRELDRVVYMLRQILEQKRIKPFATLASEEKALTETVPLLEEGKRYLDAAAPDTVKAYNALAARIETWQRDLATRKQETAKKAKELAELRRRIPRVLPDLTQYRSLLERFVKDFPDAPETADYRRALEFLPAWTAAVALRDLEIDRLPGRPDLSARIRKLLEAVPDLKKSAWGPDLEQCLAYLDANSEARKRAPLLLAAKSETLNLLVTRYRRKGETEWKRLYSPKPLVSKTEVDDDGNEYRVYWGRVYYYEKATDKPWLIHTSKVFPHNLDTREYDVRIEKRRQDNLVGHGKFLYRFVADATDAKEMDIHILEGIRQLLTDETGLPLVPRAWLLKRLTHFLDDTFRAWIPETGAMTELVDQMNTDAPWMNPAHPAVLAAEKQIRALLPRFPPVEPIELRLRAGRRLLAAALSRKVRCIGSMQAGRDRQLAPYWVASPARNVWILAADSPTIRPVFKIAAKKRENGGILFTGVAAKEHFTGQVLLAPGDERTAREILRHILPDQDLKDQLRRPASWPVNAW